NLIHGERRKSANKRNEGHFAHSRSQVQTPNDRTPEPGKRTIHLQRTLRHSTFARDGLESLCERPRTANRGARGRDQQDSSEIHEPRERTARENKIRRPRLL